MLELKLPGAGEGARDEPRVAKAVLAFGIVREVLRPGCSPTSLERFVLEELYCEVWAL